MASSLPDSSFEWKPEYQSTLENIVSTDTLETEWPFLRDIIKHKLEQNITLFLETTKPSALPTPFPQTQTQNGGLKIAPFPPHKLARVHLNEKPVSYMTRTEAEEAKKTIFSLLDDQDSAPFSLQRLVELIAYPKQHYNAVGKYLRAVEKSLLVTSTHASFPPLNQDEQDSFGRGASLLGPTRQSAPATPLFSPIPFLHGDARVVAGSPAGSPLVLNATLSGEGTGAAGGGGGGGEGSGREGGTTVGGEMHAQPLETKALGLVDEMDDPRPGHLSDHPTALSAVTELGPEHSPRSPPMPATATATAAAAAPPPAKKPFLKSLEERFVKEQKEPEQREEDEQKQGNKSEGEKITVDEDKENAHS